VGHLGAEEVKDSEMVISADEVNFHNQKEKRQNSSNVLLNLNLLSNE
jgi:hypothetical protein